MAFLDETGAKLLAQKIIEKAGSGNSSTNNYSLYVKLGANQYITAEYDSNNKKYTGLLYTWIPTIENQPSGSECGLMSRTSYNNLNTAYLISNYTGLAFLSGFQLVYYRDYSSMNANPAFPFISGGNAFFGNIGATVSPSSDTSIVKIYASGFYDNDTLYATLLIEVIPQSTKKLFISYNGKLYCNGTRSAGCPLSCKIPFSDFKKGATFTITSTAA